MAKVLVIDDSSFQRKSICKIINDLGHETDQAANGAEGLRFLENTRYDCIFCDLLMPEMDGNNFLEAIGKLENKTPVVILTADKQVSSCAHAKRLGAKDVLNKPPKPEEISEIMAKIL